MRYHHLGMPTQERHDGERYLEAFGVHVVDHTRNPFGIEWMRYEPWSPLPNLVKTMPHLAFVVDDLDSALQGQEIIIAPNAPSDGVRVAFIVSDGAPVELMEFEGERATSGGPGSSQTRPPAG
jgi:hypothetical protein